MKNTVPRTTALLLCLRLWACVQAETGPVDARARPQSATDAPVLAATVGGQPIYVQDVERQLESALRDRPVEEAARPFIQAVALEQLIRRELVLRWLMSSGQAASANDVELEIRRLERSLERQGLTLDEYCRRARLDDQQLRRTLQWQLSWQRFLDRYLTEENLQRYFERHRQDWDGSRLRVAHILLKVDVTDAEKLAATRARAEQIREEIVAGKRTFSEAAKEHSQAPSAEQGGDLGCISRHEPMPEEFSRAAFRLQRLEVSPPVLSRFGVHLITCLEVEPGQRTFREAGPGLVQAATQFLFDWAAARQHDQVPIQTTGAIAALPPELAVEFLAAPTGP